MMGQLALTRAVTAAIVLLGVCEGGEFGKGLKQVRDHAGTGSRVAFTAAAGSRAPCNADRPLRFNKVCMFRSVLHTA